MNIVFVGLSGVPYSKRACDSRLEAIANLLSYTEDVVILNRYSAKKRDNLDIGLASKVIIREIIKHRSTSNYVTVILFLLSILYEPFVLFSMRRKRRIDFLHLYSGHFFDFVFYYIISRFLGAKVVYEYVELRSEKMARPNLYHRINNWLCEKYGPYLWDSCIVISDFLKQEVNKVTPNLPVIKVTPLCDFNQFESNKQDVEIDGSYLMFCGSAGYFEVVKIIIDSYNKSISKSKRKLLLVLRGSNEQIRKVHEYDSSIMILSDLSYEKLIAYYKHAFALLIPLRGTLEDAARFPNKVCEYTASHGLIVTTDFGEMKCFFQDGNNAVVAKSFNVDSIARCLDDIENGKYDLCRIKENSFQTGKENFSIYSYREKLPTFLKDNR